MPRIYCDICGAEFRKGKTFHAHLKKSECMRVSALMKELVANQEIEIDNHEDTWEVVPLKSGYSGSSPPNQPEEWEVDIRRVSDPLDVSLSKQLDNRVDDIKEEHVSHCSDSTKLLTDSIGQFKEELSDSNLSKHKDYIYVIKDIKQEELSPFSSSTELLKDNAGDFKRELPDLSLSKHTDNVMNDIKQDLIRPCSSSTKLLKDGIGDVKQELSGLSLVKHTDNVMNDIKQEDVVSPYSSSTKLLKDSVGNFKQELSDLSQSKHTDYIYVIKEVKEEPACPSLSPVKKLDGILNCIDQELACPVLYPIKQQPCIAEHIKENPVNLEYDYSKNKVDTIDKSVWHDSSPACQGPIYLENESDKSSTEVPNHNHSARSSVSSIDSDMTSTSFPEVVVTADGEIPVFDFDCSDSDYSDGIDWDSLEAQGKLETVFGGDSKKSSQSMPNTISDKRQNDFVTDVSSFTQNTSKTARDKSQKDFVTDVTSSAQSLSKTARDKRQNDFVTDVTSSAQSLSNTTRGKSQKDFVIDVTRSTQKKSKTTSGKGQVVLGRDARLFDNIPKTTRKRGRPPKKVSLEKNEQDHEKNEIDNDSQGSSILTTPGKFRKRKKGKKS